MYNVDSQVGYNYIQRAIDNASAGDEIILSAGTFNENIVIDTNNDDEPLTGLTLSGSGIGTIITVQPPFGMGSPPIADWTVPGINVTSTDVTISNLQISNFTTGILATNADSLILSLVNVDDIQGVGIHIQESINVELRNSNVLSSELSNIIVEENVELGKIKFDDKVLHRSKVIKIFTEDDIKKDKVNKDLESVYKKIKRNKKYFYSIKDIMLLETLIADGISIPSDLDVKSLSKDLTIPKTMESLIEEGQIGLFMLKLVEIIGSDDIENLDPETLYFINNLLNKGKIKKVRNQILNLALPLRV